MKQLTWAEEWNGNQMAQYVCRYLFTSSCVSNIHHQRRGFEPHTNIHIHRASDEKGVFFLLFFQSFHNIYGNLLVSLFRTFDFSILKSIWTSHLPPTNTFSHRYCSFTVSRSLLLTFTLSLDVWVCVLMIFGSKHQIRAHMPPF